MDLYHFRALVRPSYRGVVLDRLRLLPSVCVDRLHLRDLIRRQAQLLGQKTPVGAPPSRVRHVVRLALAVVAQQDPVPQPSVHSVLSNPAPK